MSGSDTPNLGAGQIMRDLRNNSRIRSQIVSELDKTVESIVSLPAGRNRRYGVSDLNDCMIRGAILDTSVGGAANGMQSALNAQGTRQTHRGPKRRVVLAAAAA